MRVKLYENLKKDVSKHIQDKSDIEELKELLKVQTKLIEKLLKDKSS